MTTGTVDLDNALRAQRTDFKKGILDEKDLSPDPFIQFSEWLELMFQEGNKYANAMVLSTVDGDGMPSSRVMLLRDISHGGFTFFTNYQSRKARDLRDNTKASLLFFWPDAERQVRIQGNVTMVDEKESDAYFKTRPLESQLGAWASAQSCVIPGRAQLEERFQKALELFKDRDVPRPVNWGGFVLKPSLFEFWQGRTGRLHDRLQYRFDKPGNKWVLERLMP